MTPAETYFANVAQGINIPPQHVCETDKKAMIKMNHRALQIDTRRNVPVTWRNIPSVLYCTSPINLIYNEEAEWQAIAVGLDRKGRWVTVFVDRALAIHLGWTINIEEK
jgi:hypothetical protein